MSNNDQIIDDHIGRVRGLFPGILDDMAAIRHNYRDTIPHQVWLYLDNTYVVPITEFIAVELTDLINALDDEQKRPYAIDAITGPAILIDTEVLTNLPETPRVSDDLETSNPALAAISEYQPVRDPHLIEEYPDLAAAINQLIERCRELAEMIDDTEGQNR